MGTTTMPAPQAEADIGPAIEAFAGRMLENFLGSADILTIFVGEQLGLYRALGDDGPATSVELAGRGGLDERYIREWLEQQAVTGILEVDDPSAPAQERVFRLPPAHAEVLLNADGLAYLTPLARLLVGVVPQLPAIVDGFRTGAGVPWQQYGSLLLESQAELNRPLFLNQLGSELLPAIPQVHERLSRPGSRVADIGCGGGWASIAIAGAYPNTRVLGVDSDVASIELARKNAAEAGVSDRVTFEADDAATLAREGSFDLVAAFEVIHDLARPVETLESMRALAGEDGTVLVMDEKVAETFTAPGDETERLMYAASVLICLPAGRADQPSAATGTAMRTETLRNYAAQAGYRSVEVLPIEAGFFRFYLLEG